MSWVTGLILVSFVPACLLILGQVIFVGELSSSLLAAGLFALCIDQARMAALDVRQVMVVRQNNSDDRLEDFWRLTLLTIIIELMGFYLASQSLGWGIQWVLLSQLGFNTFATIQIQPSSEEKLLPRPWKERLPLIFANGMAMGLMGLWMAKIAPLTIVCSLWVIAIIYTVAKLLRLGSTKQRISENQLNMNQFNPAILGELQANIYWLHDAEKFRELADSAAIIYQQLGYTQQQATRAGKLISEAYQLADDAALAQQVGDSEKEMQFYHQAKDKLTEVETILGYQKRIALHQMQWWRCFRHQQKRPLMIHLFLQHLKAVGWVNLWTAIKLTYFLLEIGRVHKSRDLETTKENAIKYWTELLKLERTQYPYLG